MKIAQIAPNDPLALPPGGQMQDKKNEKKPITIRDPPTMRKREALL